MNYTHLLAVFLMTLFFRTAEGQRQKAYAPRKKVTISIKDFQSFDPSLRASADSAVKIASAVLNSQEFRDSILKYSFPCANYGYRRCIAPNIPGRTVLDSLYRQEDAPLSLHLNNCGGGTFGESSKNVYEINSCFYTIQEDDEHLPFSYKYAYHICHEYMHIVGFFHFKSPKHRIIKEDVAENTGWIAFYILERWYAEHRIIIK